jgi:hypothetical protein
MDLQGSEDVNTKYDYNDDDAFPWLIREVHFHPTKPSGFCGFSKKLILSAFAQGKLHANGRTSDISKCRAYICHLLLLMYLTSENWFGGIDEN